MKTVAEKLGESPSVVQYNKHGKYPASTIQARFDGWNNAKEELGLESNPCRGAPPQYSEEEILEEIRRSAEQIEGVISVNQFKKIGEISISTIEERFESWNEAKKKSDLETNRSGEYDLSEKEIEDIENVVIEKDGKFRTIDLLQVLKEKTGARIHKGISLEIWSCLNDRDNGLKISHSGGGGSGSRVFIRNENMERFAEYREKLPEGTEPVFEECLNHGNSPQGILGALLYLFGEPCTQAEAADEAGCSDMTIRNCRDFIKENGLEELVDEGGTE